MIRWLTLTLLLANLAPLGPISCPPLTEPPDGAGAERHDLLVTAEGPTESAVAGETVLLRATVPDATASAGLAFAWAQLAGPGVQLVNADTSQAQFTAPSLKDAQWLRFVVAVYDDAGGFGRAEVSVSIASDPNYGQTPSDGGAPPARPVANAGADQRALPDTTVTLDGSASRGADLRFSWRRVSGPAVTLNGADTAKPTFVVPAFTLGGVNVVLFELAVTDTEGRTVTDRVQVTIQDPSLSDRQVRIVTSKGSITVDLEVEKSPITVQNFLQYVDDEFYDNTLFHRVIPGFVVQGGGYEPGLELKETRDPIVNEARTNGLSNVRGTLAMARTNDPDSATSQFFINVANNVKDGDGKSDLDPNGVSPEGYAVFGHVSQGMDVVDAIAAVETESREGFQDVPVEDVLIISIRRTQAGTNVGGLPVGG